MMLKLVTPLCNFASCHSTPPLFSANAREVGGAEVLLVSYSAKDCGHSGLRLLSALVDIVLLIAAFVLLTI